MNKRYNLDTAGDLPAGASLFHLLGWCVSNDPGSYCTMGLARMAAPVSPRSRILGRMPQRDVALQEASRVDPTEGRRFPRGFMGRSHRETSLSKRLHG
jgi:hypothetical protein